MTIRNRLALYSSGSWSQFLPPFNATITANEVRESSVYAIPFGGIEIPYSKRQGWVIDFEAEPDESSIANGLAFQDSLRDALSDSDGNAREVHFCWWADTDGTYDRIYRYCKLTGPLRFHAGKFEAHRRFSFQLTSTDAGHYDTEPGGTRPGTSDYETYVYNGAAGSAAVPVSQLLHSTVYFNGLLEVTSATNKPRMQHKIIVPGSGSYSVTGLQVTCASLDAAASGNTTILVSDAEWDGGGNTISLSIAETAADGSNTGSISVSGGDPIYVYVTAIAGGHGDVCATITIESA